MRVSDYILQRLSQEGVRHVFMTYGGAIGELMDAFTRTDAIKYVAMMGEQTAGFAAEGYAKTAGGLGVAFATSGPGGGNLVTAIQNCYYDSVPCLFITGQVNTQFMRKSSGVRQRGFQETDIVSIVRPITKYAVRVTNPAYLRDKIETAIARARDGRPGPVLLDIPVDVQRAEIDANTPARILNASTTEDCLVRPIQSLIADLEKAEHPAFLIGGGCANYKRQFWNLAVRLRIPAFPTWNALDIVTSDLPTYGGRIGTYGGAGRNFGIQTCDLLVAVGSRISGRITGGQPHTFAARAKKYYVDIDAALLQRENQDVPADVNIHADAGRFMTALHDALPEVYERKPWLERVRAWRSKYHPVTLERFCEWHHYGYMQRLSHHMPSNAIITADTGGNVITFAHAFETKRGQRYFTSNGNTPMGFSMAAAIGAWFADPTRPIVAIIGDGGFQFNIQELQTIKHYGIPLKVFVFNNEILGNTKAYQLENLGGRCVACGPDGYSVPDFPAVVNAYGIPCIRHRNATAYKYIGDVMKLYHQVVIDVYQPGFCDYAPKMVKWDRGIEHMSPELPEDEMKENMR